MFRDLGAQSVPKSPALPKNCARTRRVATIGVRLASERRYAPLVTTIRLGFESQGAHSFPHLAVFAGPTAACDVSHATQGVHFGL